jgi:hypothetical protein
VSEGGSDRAIIRLPRPVSTEISGPGMGFPKRFLHDNRGLGAANRIGNNRRPPRLEGSRFALLASRCRLGVP